MVTRFRIQSVFFSSVLPSFAVLSATFGCAQQNDGDTGSTMGSTSVSAQPTVTASDTGTGTGTGTGTDLPAEGPPGTMTTLPPVMAPGTNTSAPTGMLPTATTSSPGTGTALPTSSMTTPAPTGSDTGSGDGTGGTGGTEEMPPVGSSSAGGDVVEAGAPPVAGGDVYNPDFKEFYGEDCEVSEPAEVNNPKLPDLFEFFDGTRMSKKSDWRCRRAELKKAVETFIHGEKPGRPDTVTGSVSNSSIDVHVEHGGKSIDFSVSVSIPGGASGPVPAIIGLGGGSLDKGILSEEGVASINYNNNSMSSESNRSGLFSQIYGDTGASAQVGWAWGVSRIIDVLVDERDAGRNDIIDPTAIGVTGCSRLGKGAFTIGAFDERIALGIPQESGTGGVSAFRVVNTAPGGPNGKPAQSLDSAWSEAQGWFGTVFGSYRSKVDVIPADTHSLVAMYAPRGLLVLDNSRIGELGSSAQHAASAAGALVYKALGAEGSIEYHGGNPSDPHNHCSFYMSQAEPLRHAIRAHLTRTEEPSGKIEPQPAGTADLTEWIDWEAPTLE